MTADEMDRMYEYFADNGIDIIGESEQINGNESINDDEDEKDDKSVNVNLSVPEGVNVGHVLQAGFSMMDGLQLRWLRAPGQDLNTMWADCEDVLMPLPLWEGYR